ncbi:MAG TPA: hypothetical protein VMW49_07705 [Candidatus Dormibacteraeota bacterium]|nr:hypothetical protein [Candidatus Dormibacteraeota bacterium]
MSGTPPDRPRRALVRAATTLPGRLRQRYQETAAQRPSEDIAMRVLASFLATFAAVRVITHGIRGGWLPLRNIELGGRARAAPGAAAPTAPPLHVHHMVFGILALTGTGYLAMIRGDHRTRRRFAPLYGAGVALTFDEFALWLRLEDDYWARQGRASVDAVILLAASFGLVAASPLFWRRALDEVRRPLAGGPAPSRGAPPAS